MPFTEQGYKNFQDYQRLVKANPGKTILQLMDGFKVAPLEAAGNRNPNNPNSFVYQGYTPHKPTDPGGDQSQGGDTYGPGGQPVPNALGWDSSAFGDQAYWSPTDTLPNGQTVAAHLDQLKNYKWPSYASKPSGTNFLQDIMAGIKSPGIAPVLGAAGIGSFLGGGFSPGAIDASWGSQAGNLGNLSGGAAASGAGMDFSALSDAATGFNPDPFGAGPGLPDFGLQNTFDMGANAGLPGAGSSATGNWWEPFVGQGGSALSSIPTSGLNQVFDKVKSIPGGTSALQKFLSGNADASDYAKLLGTIGATGLSMLNSSNQSNALQAQAAKLEAFGAPSRARYEASYAPGFDIGAADPAYAALKNQTSDTLLRRLSAQSGNPFGNPGGLIEANKQIGSSLDAPWLQNYRNQNAATSGIASFSAAAPGAAQAAIGSQGGALTNLAGGISDILNPKPQALTLQDLLRQMGGNQNQFSLV